MRPRAGRSTTRARPARCRRPARRPDVASGPVALIEHDATTVAATFNDDVRDRHRCLVAPRHPHGVAGLWRYSRHATIASTPYRRGDEHGGRTDAQSGDRDRQFDGTQQPHSIRSRRKADRTQRRFSCGPDCAPCRSPKPAAARTRRQTGPLRGSPRSEHTHLRAIRRSAGESGPGTSRRNRCANASTGCGRPRASRRRGSRTRPAPTRRCCGRSCRGRPRATATTPAVISAGSRPAASAIADSRCDFVAIDSASPKQCQTSA